MLIKAPARCCPDCGSGQLSTLGRAEADGVVVLRDVEVYCCRCCGEEFDNEDPRLTEGRVPGWIDEAN